MQFKFLVISVIDKREFQKESNSFLKSQRILEETYTQTIGKKVNWYFLENEKKNGAKNEKD